MITYTKKFWNVQKLDLILESFWWQEQKLDPILKVILIAKIVSDYLAQLLDEEQDKIYSVCHPVCGSCFCPCNDWKLPF